MSMLKGAGVRRSKRTRVPFGVMVNVSAPLPPLTSAVSVPSPPSNRSLSSPGFQIIVSLPASPNTWSLPSPPVSVSLPAPPNSRSLPPLPSRTSLPAWPNSWSFAGAADQRVVAVAAEQVGGGQRPVRLVERERVVAVLAEHLDQRGVGDGRGAALDRNGAAPRSREVYPRRRGARVTEFLRASPITVSTPAFGRKLACGSHGVVLHEVAAAAQSSALAVNRLVWAPSDRTDCLAPCRPADMKPASRRV